MKLNNILLGATLAGASLVGDGIITRADAKMLVGCGPNLANYIVEEVPVGCYVLQTNYGEPAVDYGDLQRTSAVETRDRTSAETMLTEPDTPPLPNAVPDTVPPNTTLEPRVQDPEPTGAMPPLPENRAEPVARVTPVNGQVDVRLSNNTNALITYEAVSFTQRRTLAAGETIVLQDLPTPVTITMVRQDRGFLEVVPVPASESGLLEVTLDEAQDLDDNQGVLRIQSDGQVYLN
jgi:hypothetical protein